MPIKTIVIAILVLCTNCILSAGTFEKIDSVLNLHSKQKFISYMDNLQADSSIAYMVYKDYDLTPKHKCIRLYFMDLKDKNHTAYVSEVVYINDVIHLYNFNDYQQTAKYRINLTVNRLESISIWKGNTKFFHDAPEVFGFGGSYVGGGFDWMKDGIEKGTITYSGLIAWLYIKQPVLNAYAVYGMQLFYKEQQIKPTPQLLARMDILKTDKTIILFSSGCTSEYGPVGRYVERVRASFK